MGEKETATTAREASAPSISEREAQTGKASGGKQAEEQQGAQEGEVGLEAGKASGGKQVEEQKMQPGGGGAGASALKSKDKASPELMMRAAGGGAVDPTPAERGGQVGSPKKSFAQRTGEGDDGVDDDDDSPSGERGMNSIRNMKD